MEEKRVVQPNPIITTPLSTIDIQIGGKKPPAIDREKLGEIIQQSLLNYTFQDIHYEEDTSGGGYPLYEQICLKDETVDKGKKRIDDIVDSIMADILENKQWLKEGGK